MQGIEHQGSLVGHKSGSFVSQTIVCVPQIIKKIGAVGAGFHQSLVSSARSLEVTLVVAAVRGFEVRRSSREKGGCAEQEGGKNGASSGKSKLPNAPGSARSLPLYWAGLC